MNRHNVDSNSCAALLYTVEVLCILSFQTGVDLWLSSAYSVPGSWIICKQFCFVDCRYNCTEHCIQFRLVLVSTSTTLLSWSTSAVRSAVAAGMLIVTMLLGRRVYLVSELLFIRFRDMKNCANSGYGPYLGRISCRQDIPKCVRCIS